MNGTECGLCAVPFLALAGKAIGGRLESFVVMLFVQSALRHKWRRLRAVQDALVDVCVHMFRR